MPTEIRGRLRFQGMATYKDRLKKYHESTGLLDAVSHWVWNSYGYKVAIAVDGFRFSRSDHGIGRWRENYAHDEMAGTALRGRDSSLLRGARMYEGM